jgi:hypothetical protein
LHIELESLAATAELSLERLAETAMIGKATWEKEMLELNLVILEYFLRIF